MGVLYCFQNTTIFSSLLHQLLYALLYIFSEIVHIYRILVSLPRVNIKTFKKEVYYYFLKKTDGNALQNRQLYTYFTENILDDIH